MGARMAEKLKRAVFFNILLYCEDKRLDEKIAYLKNEYCKRNGRLRGPNNDTALRLLLLNLCSTRNFLAVSLDQNHYADIPSRYNPAQIKSKSLCKWIHFLEKRRYIELKIGYQFNSISRISRIRVTRKFKKKLFIPALQITRNPSEELLMLKDKNKKLLDYLDDEEVRRMRANLSIINNFSKTFALDFNGIKMDPTYKRVFNNSSWDLGGRFYAAHMCLPGPKSNKPIKRNALTINGEATVELDFKCLHINILYLKKTGKIYSGDAYLIDGYEAYRDAFKIILLIIINTKSEPAALFAIKKAIETTSEFSGLNPIQALNIFLIKHSPIRKYFFSGLSLQLQKTDSILAEAILLRATKDGIPVVSVHDSFITKASMANYLKGIMLEESAKITGQVPISRRDYRNGQILLSFICRLLSMAFSYIRRISFFL